MTYRSGWFVVNITSDKLTQANKVDRLDFPIFRNSLNFVYFMQQKLSFWWFSHMTFMLQLQGGFHIK